MQILVLKPEWQCSNCTAAQKLSRGCTEEATNPIEMEGELQMRCPRRIMLDRPQFISELWWLYSNYCEGILPEHGGLYDQPAKFLAAVRVLQAAKSAADSEKQDGDKVRRARRAEAQSTFDSGF